MCEIKYDENYRSDTGRIINKFDIYLCDLGEGEEISGGDIGKVRPCVVVSSDNYNNPKSCRYMIAPIRTEHNENINKDNVQEFIKRKKEFGTLYADIEMNPGDIRFVDVTEIRKVSYCKLVKYICSVINPETKSKINKLLAEYLFSAFEIPDIIGISISDLNNNFVIGNISRSKRNKIEDSDNFKSYYDMFKSGSIKAFEAARELNVCTNTFYNAIKRYENKNLITN